MAGFRISLAFHETFSLTRPAVAQVLGVIADLSESDKLASASLRSELSAKTSLGNNYIKSMPRYAQGVGLVDNQYQLTQFGRTVISSDASLDNVDTHWLFHYFMSAPDGPGPLFWHELCSSRFRVGNRFTRKEVADDISSIYERTEGKSISASALRSTTTIFLGTYTKSDGLGNLGIIQKQGEEYVVTQPDPPSPWVVAYALADEWQRRYAGRLSVNLDDFLGDRGLATLFLMDDAAFNNALAELHRAGVVELYRSVRPYQLLLLSQDQEAMLRKLYGIENSHSPA